LALLAGFATMALIIVLVTVLLKRLVPSWADERGKPQAGYIFVNLGCSFLAAAAGGYVTAWAASNNPLIHVLGLGLSVLMLAALSALQQRGQQPIWYLLALVALSPLGVLAGGMVRLRVLGVL
jgi:hypothetical protein